MTNKIITTQAEWLDARKQVSGGEVVSAKWAKPIGAVLGDAITTKEAVKKFLIGINFGEEVAQEQSESTDIEKYSALIPVVISQEEEDRDGDIVHIDGMRLDEYIKNPVMLFGHDQARPAIGNGLFPTKIGNQARAIAAFTCREVDPWAGMIGELYARGIMRAISIGFMGDGILSDRGAGKIDWIESELIEFSAVNVPSNRNALSLAKSYGIDMAPLSTEIESLLDATGMVALPRADLETAWKQLRGTKTFSGAALLSSAVDDAKELRALKRRSAVDKIQRGETVKAASSGGVVNWQGVAAVLAKEAPELFVLAVDANTFDASETDEIEAATKSATEDIDAVTESLAPVVTAEPSQEPIVEPAPLPATSVDAPIDAMVPPSESADPATDVALTPPLQEIDLAAIAQSAIDGAEKRLRAILL